MTQEDAVSVKEFARLAGVKPRQVYRWWRKGRVEPIGKTPGGRPRFLAGDAVKRG